MVACLDPLGKFLHTYTTCVFAGTAVHVLSSNPERCQECGVTRCAINLHVAVQAERQFPVLQAIC